MEIIDAGPEDFHEKIISTGRYNQIVPSHEAKDELSHNSWAAETAEVLEDEVGCAIEKYDLPIAPKEIHCYIGTWGGPAQATASPYKCDEYKVYTGGPTGVEWRVTNPDGFMIIADADLIWKGEEHTRAVVRHEIAHIMGWVTEGVTYEQKKNHAYWLDELDAEW